jgi:hypothetical protein
MATVQQNEWVAQALGVDPNVLGGNPPTGQSVGAGASPTLIAKAETAAQHHAAAAQSGGPAKQGGKPAKQVGKPVKHVGEKVGHDGEKAAGEGKKPEGQGESKEGSGEEKKPGGQGESKEDSGTIAMVFKWIVSEASDVTLKAQVGSAMPEGKTADDFKWQGPIKTIAEYNELTWPFRATLAYAQVEIAFFYSGKYINNFHAKLINADLDKLASLSCELTVDDQSVGNSADGIAHIDWTVTFHRGHPFGSKVSTVTGRVSGDGRYTTSQPGVFDFVQEAQQEVAARTPHK